MCFNHSSLVLSTNDGLLWTAKLEGEVPYKVHRSEVTELKGLGSTPETALANLHRATFAHFDPMYETILYRDMKWVVVDNRLRLANA